MAFTEKYSSANGAGAHDGTSEANAWTLPEAATAINTLGAGGAAGLRLNHKGDVTRTASDSFTSGTGTIASPFVIRGYLSTIGDAYLGRTNGNGPLITTNMPTITYNSTFAMSVGAYTIVEGIKIVGNRSGGVFLTGSNANVVARAVSVLNSSTNSAARAIITGSGQGQKFYDCDLALSSSVPSYVFSTSGTNCTAIRCCRIIAAGGSAIQIASATAIVDSCVIYGASVGIDCTVTGVNGVISNNTIVGCTGNAIQFVTGQTGLVEVFGNLITDGSSNAMQCPNTGNGFVVFNNRLNRNTTNIANGGDWVTATSYGHNTTSVTQAQEFTDYAGNDFRLASTSPARANGLPAHRDIGALQHQDSADGGTSIIVPSFGGRVARRA